MNFQMQNRPPRRQSMRSIFEARFARTRINKPIRLKKYTWNVLFKYSWMSNEHENAIKLKLESLSTKLADDSVEERVTSVLHAPCTHGNWNAWTFRHGIRLGLRRVETKILKFLSPVMIRHAGLRGTVSNCTGHALMANWPNNYLKLLVLELVWDRALSQNGYGKI